MQRRHKDTLKAHAFPFRPAICAFVFLFSLYGPGSQAEELIPPQENDADQIQIIEGEDRLIYEYRQNGVLTMIKVVPENGRPYYMVPADGAPHYESLDHKRRLYPQWVIMEW